MTREEAKNIIWNKFLERHFVQNYMPKNPIVLGDGSIVTIIYSTIRGMYDDYVASDYDSVLNGELVSLFVVFKETNANGFSKFRQLKNMKTEDIITIAERMMA